MSEQKVEYDCFGQSDMGELHKGPFWDYTDYVPGGPVTAEPLFQPGPSMTHQELIDELANLRNELTAVTERLNSYMAIARGLCEWKEEFLQGGPVRLIGSPPVKIRKPQPEVKKGKSAPYLFDRITEFTILLERTRINQKLTGNSKVSKWTKDRILAVDQDVTSKLTLYVLREMGLEPEDFLTPLDGIFPLQMDFNRYYCGHDQAYDTDNLPMAFKGYRDGVCRTLLASVAARGRDDSAQYINAVYNQIRTKSRTALEIVVKLAGP